MDHVSECVPFASFPLFVKAFTYLLLAVLGLRCCTRAFSGCGEWGRSPVAERRLLTAGLSFVAEHRLWTVVAGFSSCSWKALE